MVEQIWGEILFQCVHEGEGGFAGRSRRGKVLLERIECWSQETEDFRQNIFELHWGCIRRVAGDLELARRGQSAREKKSEARMDKTTGDAEH